MPLHIDVKVNDRQIHRINIARMTRNGMNDDSINEYAVVVSEQRRAYFEAWPFMKEVFSDPEEKDWDDSIIRFTHRQGDGALVCTMKALQAVSESKEILKAGAS
jgi:hypothetical protein